MIEPEFADAFNAWKDKPGPDANAQMLKTLHPVIEGALKTHVGQTDPLLFSRARRMTLDGLQTYDPERGKLKTHLYSHLKSMKRVARQQSAVMRVPERISLDRYNLDTASKELSHTLGREPTDQELADNTGFSPKRMARVRQYVPAVAEGTMEETGGGQVLGSTATPGSPHHNVWADLIYGDLDPYHQKVMEHAWGLHGRRPLPNHEIAAKLRKTPGAISQAKLRIQKMLDEESELSPF